MVSVLTLAITVICSVAFKGFLSIIPILIGIVSGYVIAAFNGLVNWQAVIDAPWFALPTIYTPEINFSAIVIILPAALVVIVEHIGHLLVTGNIVGENLAKNPGLDRSLLGNGLSTIFSGCFGSTPNTTYGENIGVLAITKVYSTWVIGGAAVFAILLSCLGKLAAAIQSIPTPVMSDNNSQSINNRIAIWCLHRQVQDHRVDFRITIPSGSQNRHRTGIELLRQQRRIVIVEHRITRPVI